MLRRPSALSDLLAGRAEPTRRAWTISTSRGGPSAVSPLARASTRVSPSLEIDAGTRSRPGVTSRTARLSTCPATLGGSRRASLEPRAWTYLVVREVVLSVVARLAEALAPQRGLRGQGLRASSDAPGTASEVFSSAPQGAATIVTARVSTCPVATRTFPARESRDSCLERPHSAGSRVCSRRASHGGPCSSRTSPSGTGLARTSEPGDVESCLGARVAEDKPDRIAVVREGSTSSPRGTRRPETASFAFRRRCCRRAARRDLAVALVDMLQDFDPFVARLTEARDHSLCLSPTLPSARGLSRTRRNPSSTCRRTSIRSSRGLRRPETTPLCLSPGPAGRACRCAAPGHSQARSSARAQPQIPARGTRRRASRPYSWFENRVR